MNAEPLLTAAELAEATGFSKWFVYQHADELAVIRFGNGPKARLRFRLTDALAALENRSPKPAAAAALDPQPPRRRRRPAADDGLIPIRRPLIEERAA